MIHQAKDGPMSPVALLHRPGERKPFWATLVRGRGFVDTSLLSPHCPKVVLERGEYVKYL